MKRLALIFIILLSLFAASCSAVKLHDRSIQKGYVHTIDIDTIKVPYLVVKNIQGKDSLIYRDSLIPKVVAEYIPRWRTRFDNKRFKDSLAHIREMYEDSLRNALKTQKIALKSEKVEAKKETKKTRHENKKRANLFILGLVVGIILTLIIRYAANQALKKLA